MIRRPPRSPLFLHDALPICDQDLVAGPQPLAHEAARRQVDAFGRAAHEDDLALRRRAYEPANGLAARLEGLGGDRKSTRLNSSHLGISYAVFCLKKQNNINM